MDLNNYKYGFTMSLHEYVETIPTLWEETKVSSLDRNILTSEICTKESSISVQWQRPGIHFVRLHCHLTLTFSENKGDTYNNCHFVPVLLL